MICPFEGEYVKAHLEKRMTKRKEKFLIKFIGGNNLVLKHKSKIQTIKKTSCRKVVLLILMLVFCCHSTLAQTTQSLNQANAVNSTWKDELYQGHLVVSDWFNGFTESVDYFLTGREVVHRDKPSEIRLQSLSSSKEGSDFNQSFSLGFRPRLHALEENFYLTFTSYNDVDENHQAGQKLVRQSPLQENYGATVGFFQKFSFIRVDFQPRIEFKNSLQISHSLNFETVLDLKNFLLNPRFQLFASATQGTGVFHALNFRFNLSENNALSFLNEFEYLDKVHKYSVSNGVVWGQRLNDTSGLSYGFMFYSTNQPSYHLDKYIPSVSWNHLIYKKLLDYEFTPYLEFSKEHEFKGSAGINLNFNLTF